MAEAATDAAATAAAEAEAAAAEAEAEDARAVDERTLRTLGERRRIFRNSVFISISSGRMLMHLTQAAAFL